MAVKSVVCHDTPQIRVPDEENAKEIIDLSLVPVGPIVEACDAWNRRGLVRICLDSDAGVMAHTQKVVDNFEPLFAGREVHGSDVRYLREFGRGVVYRASVRVSAALQKSSLHLRKENTGMTPAGDM